MQNISKPLYSVLEAISLLGIGKTYFYRELAAGRIRAVKSGRRTLVPAEAISDWIAALPTANPASDQKGV